MKYYYRYKKLPKKESVAAFVLLGIFSLSLLSASLLIRFSNQAAALSGSDFKASRIIDDGVFFDGSAMKALDIQHFLNAKMPSCDTNGSKIYNASQTRAQYGESQGYPAPYTCLRDYSQNTPSMAAETGLCNTYTGGAKTSAQIIYDVGQSCGINPQVMLVLLQKEQSLVTDEWPWPVQYKSATGFSCPDTAPCDPSYAGFFYQVYYAARQFKKYARDSTQYNYRANRDNFIQYNPNTACGGTSVFIENQATAGLYVYTPYQPNSAALNNLNGEGDGCSAYGNRNFWRMFNDWFGSTFAAPYYWKPIAQEIHADAARTKPLSVDSYAPGSTYYLRVTVQNMGNRTWQNTGDNPVNLATTHDRGKLSIFCDSSWLTCSRAATLREASVAPGGIGTFEFSIKAPTFYGFYKEYFSLVAEGATWMNDVGLHWYLPVREPIPTWQPVSQEMHADSARTRPLSVDALAPNATYYLRLKALNRGNTTWTNSGSNPTTVGTSHPRDRISSFCDATWLACNRSAKLLESSVAPGNVGTFEFSVKSPANTGSYKEYFSLVTEGMSWMNDVGLHWPMPVKEPTYTWKYGGQAVYTDSTMGTAANTSITQNAARLYASIKALNTGNTTWTNSGSNPVRLGASNAKDRRSPFCDTTWLSCNRAATLKEASVAPGDTGTFEFWVQAPYAVNGTSYSEYFTPVAEGITWLNDQGLHQPFKMNSPEYVWGYVSQSAHADSARTQAADLGAAKPNTTYYLTLKAKNTSGRTWSNGGSNPLNLGTSNPKDRTSSFCDGSWLSCNRAARLKESSVAPGETGTFLFSVKTPSAAGTYTEHFLPVVEGKSWLNDLGQNWSITVQ